MTFKQKYSDFLNNCSCQDCGKRYADRPRDADGIAMDVWVTEVQCMDCFCRLGNQESRGLPSARDIAVNLGVNV